MTAPPSTTTRCLGQGGRDARPRPRPHPRPRRRTGPLPPADRRARRPTPAAGGRAEHDRDPDHDHPHDEVRGGHDFALPALPDAVDVFDTTLRDGSQQEGLSLTVDDKLRVAEQLDHLGVTFIEGGWPGANPKDAEFFARAPKELRPRPGHPGGLRLHPAGRRAGRGRRDAPPPGRGPDRGRLHRGQVVGDARGRRPADDPGRGGRHGGRLGGVPAGQRPPGVPRRRALLRRLQGQSRVHPADPPGRRGGGRRDTGPVRHQRGHPALTRWSGSSPRCSTGSRPRSGCTSTTTAAARWPTRWPACRWGPPTSRAVSTATASGPATPTWPPWCPTCRSSCGCRPSRPTACRC